MKIFLESKFITISTILLIFIIDLIVSSGTALAILYVVPVTLSISLNKKAIINYTLIVIVLAIADTALTYHTVLQKSVVADRILSIFAIIISCLVVLRHKTVIDRRFKEKDQYLNSITEIIFKVSHGVRLPITRMQGLINIIDSEDISKEELEMIANSLKDSVIELDTVTKSLSDSLHNDQLQTHKKQKNSN